MTSVRSFCRFCEALCGITVQLEGDRVVGVRGDAEDPISHGYTCPKGRALGEWHHRDDRLDRPHLGKGAARRAVGWDELLGDMATRLEDIIAHHGRDAVGFYLATGVAFDANGRRTAERFQRALGTRSKYTATTIDTPNKLLVSELMSGHPGLVPAPDREHGKLFLFFGTNPVVSHGHLNAFPDPVVTLRKMAGRGEVWVVDPRSTETAGLASRHLPVRPGTDYALLAYLVRELLSDGADTSYLAEHAAGVDVLAGAVARFDLESAADICGLDPLDLEDLLAAIRRHGRVAGQTGTGVSMSAAANISEWLLFALHIVTGSVERPGGVWFHPGFLRQFDRRASAPTDGTAGPSPPSRPDIPARWGEIPCAAMADEIEAGNLRALIVCGGNPVLSFPDARRIAAALDSLEVLAVADVVETATTRLATHVLPVAGQLERADMSLYIDQFMPDVSTRYTPAVLDPGADRRPLWQALAQLAHRMGFSALPDGIDLESATDDDLLSVIGDRSRSTFADIVDQRVVIDAPSAAPWVAERVLPDGRWRLAPEPLVAQLAGFERPSRLTLVPRRQLRHLNSQMHDTGSGGRRDLPEVQIHPSDAEESAVADGSPVVVTSPTGRLTGIAAISSNIRRGAVSVPHGFADPNVGLLTSSTDGVDSLTGMVLQSGIPVKLAPA